MRETKDMITRPHDEGRVIPRVKRRGERLIGLFIAGIVLLNFPLLSVFSVNRMIFGIPVLYLYLFVVWVLIIIITRIVLRGRSADQTSGELKPKE